MGCRAPAHGRGELGGGAEASPRQDGAPGELRPAARYAIPASAFRSFFLESAATTLPAART